MAESRVQAYKLKVDELTKFAAALGPEAERQVSSLLADANREIVRDLALTTPDSYTESRLRMLRDAIERTMQQFRTAATRSLNTMQDLAYRSSALQVDQVASAATGGRLIQPVIDARKLVAAQGYTADLINGLSQDASNKIVSAVQRAYLGNTTTADLIATVGEARDGKFTGFFGIAGRRAADTASNEVLRVHSIATDARITDLSQQNSNIQKQWIHMPIARVPRVTHVLANNQVRDAGEPFDVGGEQLMFPRDPGASAENSIFCHCLERPYVNPDALKPTDQERDLLKSLGLSVTTSRR